MSASSSAKVSGQPKPYSGQSADWLHRRGYRTVSGKYGIVARIDRADWREAVPDAVREDLRANFFRRFVSKDKIGGVPREVIAEVLSSDIYDGTGFICLPEETDEYRENAMVGMF